MSNEGTNYSPIQSCQCASGVEKKIQSEAVKTAGSRDMMLRTSGEKLDSVSVLSRVFDGLTVTR